MVKVRDTIKDTQALREILSKVATVVIDGQDIHFIFKDDESIILNEFQCKVLLTHSLGLEVDWDATY